jgi:hypothetical protein
MLEFKQCILCSQQRCKQTHLCHLRLKLERPMHRHLCNINSASMHINTAPCSTLSDQLCLLPLLYCSPTTSTASVALLTQFDASAPANTPTATLTLKSLTSTFNCTKSPSGLMNSTITTANPGADNICSGLPSGETAYVVFSSDDPDPVNFAPVLWSCVRRTGGDVSVTPYPNITHAVQLTVNDGDQITCVALYLYVPLPASPSPSPSPTDPSPSPSPSPRYEVAWVTRAL